MIHVFINALSASAGGGLTYVRNILPRLAERGDVRVTMLVNDALRKDIPESSNVTLLSKSSVGWSGRRFWHEQRTLPAMMRRSGAEVLLSTGNFALFRSPVPQILLSRNALYVSADFLRDVRERRDYRLWADTALKSMLARWSVRIADRTVAPSETFAAQLRDWTGKEVSCIHHGFDRRTFFDESVALPQTVQARIAATEGSIQVLFASHYNYYRNFETLIRAIAILKQKLGPKRVRLILTCKLESGENPGSYRAASAARLVRELALQNEVVELGAVPYAALHHLYQACDFYVSPAYAETFAHPLVEAMASGLPVIASDLPVHREICGDAAVYFSRFSAEELAQCIAEALGSDERRATMRRLGLSRSQDFSWDQHVDRLLILARSLSENRGSLG